MNLEEACRSVLGKKIADEITAEQGFEWTIFAAVACARTDDNPMALATIRQHLDEEKRKSTLAQTGEK